MATPTNRLPDCGLFRTTKALPGNEEKVPANCLVYFHNHSDSNLPQVLPPDHNILNRWHFHGPGIVIRGTTWLESLDKVPEEGFYTLKRELSLEPEGKWLKNAIVQLGYTKAAEPILFIGQQRAALAENDLFFSDKGLKITLEQARTILERAPIFEEPADGTAHTSDHASH
ncbi:MAG TPA: hypothetical protein VF316_19660 [Polyangiaceae bacterium]